MLETIQEYISSKQILAFLFMLAAVGLVLKMYFCHQKISLHLKTFFILPTNQQPKIIKQAKVGDNQQVDKNNNIQNIENKIKKAIQELENKLKGENIQQREEQNRQQKKQFDDMIEIKINNLKDQTKIEFENFKQNEIQPVYHQIGNIQQGIQQSLDQFNEKQIQQMNFKNEQLQQEIKIYQQKVDNLITQKNQIDRDIDEIKLTQNNQLQLEIQKLKNDQIKIYNVITEIQSEIQQQKQISQKLENVIKDFKVPPPQPPQQQQQPPEQPSQPPQQPPQPPQQQSHLPEQPSQPLQQSSQQQSQPPEQPSLPPQQPSQPPQQQSHPPEQPSQPLEQPSQPPQQPSQQQSQPPEQPSQPLQQQSQPPQPPPQPPQPPNFNNQTIVSTLYNLTCKARQVEQEYRVFVSDFLNEAELISEYGMKKLENKNKLRQHLSGMRKARGDGNCFYTSFVFQYLNFMITKTTDQQFQELIELIKMVKFQVTYQLQNFIQSEYDELQIKFKAMCEYLRKQKEEDRINLFCQFFKDEENEFYGLSIIFLRNLAYKFCNEDQEVKDLFKAQNLNLEKQVLEWEFDCESNEGVIKLLSEKLNIKTIQFVCDSQTSLINQIEYNEEQNPKFKIFLLFRPGHYNIGVPKSN